MAVVSMTDVQQNLFPTTTPGQGTITATPGVPTAQITDPAAYDPNWLLRSNAANAAVAQLNRSTTFGQQNIAPTSNSVPAELMTGPFPPGDWRNAAFAGSPGGGYNNFNTQPNALFTGQQPRNLGPGAWAQPTTGPLSSPPLGAGTGGVNVFPQISPLGGPQMPGQYTPQNSAGAPNPSAAPRATSYGDTMLAQIASNYQRIFDQLSSSTGNPFNAEPAWEAMVAAMRRNTQNRAADLNEYIGGGGNRFSPGFAQQMSQYYDQTALDENALLAQMMMGAHESAQGRRYGALGQLAGTGAGAASQLSAQSFQQAMLEQQQAMAAAQALAGYTAGAGNTLAANSNAAATNMYNTGVGAASALAGQQTNAINTLYGGQLSALPMWLNNDQTLRQLGLSAGTNLSNQWLQQVGLGSQLGQQQYNTQLDQINRLYQEWMRTQPMYNPLLSTMFQGATTYPPQLAREPGFWDYFASIAGSVAQTTGNIAGLVGGGGG